MNCFCGRPVHSRGMCSTCYSRKWRNKTLTPKPKTECLVDDCSTLTISKWGYCDTHNSKRQWAAQKQAKQEWFERQPEENITDAVIRYAINNDVALRLFTNTKTEGECLVWKGARNGKYGSIGIRVKFGKGEGKHFSHPILTHRLAYALSNELPPSQSGPTDDTLTINHICRNTLCVNVSHLEVITQKENWEYSPPPKGLSPKVNMNVEGICVCGADFVGRENKKWCSEKCKNKHYRMWKKSAA